MSDTIVLMPNTRNIPYRQIFWWTLVATLIAVWLIVNTPEIAAARERPVVQAIAPEIRPGPVQLLVAAAADWMAVDEGLAGTWYRKAADWLDEIQSHEVPARALPESLWAPQPVRVRVPEEIALLSERGLVLPSRVLDRYVGTYRGAGEAPLVVEAREGRLFAHIRGAEVVQLAAVRSDLFVDARHSGRAFRFPEENRYDLEMLDGEEMRHYNRACTHTDHPV